MCTVTGSFLLAVSYICLVHSCQAMRSRRHHVFLGPPTDSSRSQVHREKTKKTFNLLSLCVMNGNIISNQPEKHLRNCRSDAGDLFEVDLCTLKLKSDVSSRLRVSGYRVHSILSVLVPVMGSLLETEATDMWRSVNKRKVVNKGKNSPITVSKTRVNMVRVGIVGACNGD